MASRDQTHRFEFDFDTPFSWPGRLLGMHAGTAWVDVDDQHLQARFGRWVVQTPRSNIAEATITGPYSVPKTIGPAHLSAADRGLTFATNAQRGACLRFVEPVRGMDPFGLLRHPGLTVTVADPDGLLGLLQESGTVVRASKAELDRQAALDRLQTLSASDLRALAAKRGAEHPASARRQDLVAFVEERIDEFEDELLVLADAGAS